MRHPISFRNPYLRLGKPLKKRKRKIKKTKKTSRSYILRSWDLVCYVVGILARLQTVMIGYFLFYVETDNVCVVSSNEYQPIPLELLPTDLSTLPGEFAVVSYVF